MISEWVHFKNLGNFRMGVLQFDCTSSCTHFQLGAPKRLTYFSLGVVACCPVPALPAGAAGVFRSAGASGAEGAWLGSSREPTCPLSFCSANSPFHLSSSSLRSTQCPVQSCTAIAVVVQHGPYYSNSLRVTVSAGRRAKYLFIQREGGG